LLQTGRKSAEDSRLQALDTRVWMISRPGCQWVYLIMLLKISHVKKNIGQAV